MTRLIVIFAFTLSALIINDLTHTRTIYGTITDAGTGDPVAGVVVTAKSSHTKAVSDDRGKYILSVATSEQKLVFSYLGYADLQVQPPQDSMLNVKLIRQEESVAKEETGAATILYAAPEIKADAGLQADALLESPAMAEMSVSYAPLPASGNYNTEAYDAIHETGFQETTQNPLSTFSIDVDNAAYSNVRRFLTQGEKPPKDAVRIEEMINYFRYSYPLPTGKVPFSVSTELAACPWNKQNRLLHIGLQGKQIATGNLPPSNLVFLLDVSGSMNDPAKLPLVKAGFKMLVEQLRPQDKVAIVVYAGAAGLVLPSTPGNRKDSVLAAIENLEAGGSTAGGEGLKLAYKVAQDNFRKGGNNRVILATDGDFNVGVSSDAEMERLVEQQRETGVFLTVLGFGTGNLKDSKMEKMADNGNGNYAYVDNILEARKVFVNEFGGTLFTIAKDVKLQLEFNPVFVKAYRLVGYENRTLRSEDFNNDKKDAGDLGAGHTVTALYEIVPATGKSKTKTVLVDPLKYQRTDLSPEAGKSGEVLTLKLRYKEPDGRKSSLIRTTVKDNPTPENQTSDNYRFSAAVAQFGMLLRDSEFKGSSTYDKVISQASGAKGIDAEGYRAEFINMVRAAKTVEGSAKN